MTDLDSRCLFQSGLKTTLFDRGWAGSNKLSV